MGEPQVRLAGLGRGRRWAELAEQGHTVTVLGDAGEPVAYIIPATEPITDAVIEEYIERRGSAWPKTVRAKVARELRAFRQGGGRYHRARGEFVFGFPEPGFR